MGEEEQPGDQAEPDRRAASLGKSVTMSETVARVLLIGSGVAVLLGIVGAVAIAYATSRTSSIPSGYAVSRACEALLTCLLPAGIFAASAAAIRLQASRVAAEYVDT
jgi:hypothetical protein